MSSDLRGKAITVKGVVDPNELGITSMHEHLFLDMSASWGNSAAPSDAFGLMMSREPVKLENLWWIKRQPHANLDNTRFNDYKEALDEVSYFTREGAVGKRSAPARGLGRDPKLLRWVSNEARVNIEWRDRDLALLAPPPELKNKTVDQVAELLKRDVLEGIDGSGVRAGILGEIGAEGTPDLLLHPDEEKGLKAAAKVQKESRCRDLRAPAEDAAPAGEGEPRRLEDRPCHPRPAREGRSRPREGRHVPHGQELLKDVRGPIRSSSTGEKL